MASFKGLTKSKTLKIGTYIGEFATPGIAPILKSAGCDFAFVDMEHSGASYETVKALLRNLHDAGIATMVRPQTKMPHHLSVACDVGAQGLIPPMLGTAQEAQICIDAINYPPYGKRGIALGIAHDNYQPASVSQALTDANAKTCFIGLIETAEGVDNVEEIAAHKDVDCLWIGHFDLSASLGIPGEFDDPKFTGAVEKVMKAAAAHGKSIGRLVGSKDDALTVFDQGCDFICYLGDVWLLQQALASGLASVRAEIGSGDIAGSGRNGVSK